MAFIGVLSVGLLEAGGAYCASGAEGYAFQKACVNLDIRSGTI